MNSDDFPLYDSLYNECKAKKDLSTKQKTKFLSLVEKIDAVGAEYLLTIITLFHQKRMMTAPSLQRKNKRKFISKI